MERLRKWLQALPLPTNPGGLVYGTILIAALLAAEGGTAVDYTETVVGIVLAEFVYWLALSYAEFAGDRAADGRPFAWRGFRASARHELAVVQGGVIPLLVVVGSWIAGVSLSWGLRFAIWASAAVIVLTEVAIGIRSNQRGRELVISAALGVLFGLLVISLRLILH